MRSAMYNDLFSPDHPCCLSVTVIGTCLNTSREKYVPYGLGELLGLHAQLIPSKFEELIVREKLQLHGRFNEVEGAE